MEVATVVPMPVAIRDFVDWCDLHEITGWARTQLWRIVEEIDRLELRVLREPAPSGPVMQYGSEQGGDCAHLYAEATDGDG